MEAPVTSKDLASRVEGYRPFVIRLASRLTGMLPASADVADVSEC
jgi:hypothetical protein